MRHGVDHRKLGKSTSHRKAMLRNMATSLVMSGRIQTTLPKAKELRRLADHLVTLAKEGNLHARRQAARVLRSQPALKKLFLELGDRFKDRSGGYTRIIPIGFRNGDGASLAFIEYLGYQPLSPLSPEERLKQKEAEKGSKKEAKKTPKKTKEAKADKPAKEKKKPVGKESKKETKKGFWSSLRKKTTQEDGEK